MKAGTEEIFQEPVYGALTSTNLSTLTPQRQYEYSDKSNYIYKVAPCTLRRQIRLGSMASSSLNSRVPPPTFLRIYSRLWDLRTWPTTARRMSVVTPKAISIFCSIWTPWVRWRTSAHNMSVGQRDGISRRGRASRLGGMRTARGHAGGRSRGPDGTQHPGDRGNRRLKPVFGRPLRRPRNLRR